MQSRDYSSVIQRVIKYFCDDFEDVLHSVEMIPLFGNGKVVLFSCSLWY